MQTSCQAESDAPQFTVTGHVVPSRETTTEVWGKTHTGPHHTGLTAAFLSCNMEAEEPNHRVKMEVWNYDQAAKVDNYVSAPDPARWGL